MLNVDGQTAQTHYDSVISTFDKAARRSSGGKTYRVTGSRYGKQYWDEICYHIRNERKKGRRKGRGEGHGGATILSQGDDKSVPAGNVLKKRKTFLPIFNYFN